MRQFAILTVIAVTCASPAANAQTFYNNLATFNAAAPPTTVYAFEDIAATNNLAPNPAVLTVAQAGRVTFSVTGGGDAGVYAADSGANAGIYRLSDGTDSVTAGFPNVSASTTTIALGDFYTAFGIDYGMESNATNSFTFLLFNGATQVGNGAAVPNLGGDRFFGVTSATVFNNVRVTASATGANRYVTFDNARVGPAVVVPESGTVALLLPALGVLGVVAVRRRVRVN